MSYTKLKSHPNKFLEDHLENVANFSKSSFISLNFKNNELFSKISYLIGISHDFAKSTSFFQDYLLNGVKNENTPHSFLSAIFTYYVINNYLKDNNLFIEKNLAIISYIAVLHHHGNIKDIPKLMDYHDKKANSKIIKKQIKDLKHQEGLKKYYLDKNIDLADFFEDFDEICLNISDELYDFEYDNNFDNYFNILLLYSVLLDADKMDASESPFIERKQINSNIIDDYKINHDFDEGGINKIREKAYVEVNENIKNLDLNNKILSINLPTGCGKTLTGVSGVLKLKERIYNELGFNPRIIYSLPFLSIIDQNEEVIKEIFEENNLKGTDYLLKHNYLADMKYLDNNDELYDISNTKILIEGWNSEFIITTFIQLFYSILGNKNSFLRKFHNITNSIILLDEIQAIPYKYWRIINLLLNKLAKEYNCWIILMTATQPLIFKENEIYSLIENKEYYFNQFDRIDYNFQLDDTYIGDFINDLVDVINNTNKDIMVVLNTIGSSNEVYSSLKQYYEDIGEEVNIDDNGICNIGEDINLIYLSTNIIPYYRLKRINSIKNSNKQNIIISTQLIEAGVDIDVDIVYRDIAPLDSIIQTAGRCNRSGKKEKGIVNVISLVNNEGKSYSSFIYQSLLLTTTYEVLKGVSRISEKNFNLAMSNNYFKLISKRSFEDDELKDTLNKLQFGEIPLRFKLIENLPNKIDVFVCIDENATEIFNKYEDIVENFKGFERKNEFLKIKSDFYQYVISVDERKFGSTKMSNDEIGVIYKSDLERKYVTDLGFISSDDEEPMIW